MMRKKAFTLAEVLIVLVVIGAIVAITIPTLTKGIHTAQSKTAYKKALNTIVNLVALESEFKRQIFTDSSQFTPLFNILSSNLSVKDYAEYIESKITKTSDLLEEISTDNILSAIDFGGEFATNWINTEDGFSYQLFLASQNACPDKKMINSDSFDPGFDREIEDYPDGSKRVMFTAPPKACLYVIVDINGVTKGPNTVISNKISPDEKLGDISDDRFPIYIGVDGATAGSKKTTKTGRIAANLN